jgi:carbon-monoxide dehydrogenase iron sulfur subunit
MKMAMEKQVEKKMKKKIKKIITINPKKCMACWNCLLECALAHSKSKKIPEAFREIPCPEERLSVEAVGDIAVPLHCQHCDDPPCANVCPSGALKKEEDITRYNEDLCIGCKMCLHACPFGMIKIKVEGNGIVKCDLCLERLEEGLEPACVSVCITEAIKFESADNYIEAKQKDSVEKLLAVEDN